MPRSAEARLSDLRSDADAVGVFSWEGDGWVRCDEDGNVLPEPAAFRLEPEAAL